MSYENPTNWADVDWAGNAVDWTTCQSKLIYPMNEMLRVALNERYLVITGAASTVPALAPGQIAFGTSATGWWTDFDSALGTVLVSFVKHTDANGSDHFTGNNSIPMWADTDDLATALGEDWIGTPKIPSAAWTLQRYKAINLLRWTLVDNYATGANIKKDNFYEKKVEQVGSWATVVSSFSGQSWDSIADANPARFMSWQETNGGDPDTWSAIRERYELWMKQDTEGFKVNVDIYTTGDKAIFGSPVIGDVYEDVDYSVPENELGFAEEITTPAAYTDTWTKVGDIGDYSDVPSAEPAADAARGNTKTATTDEIVLKFDVTDGFQFID